MHNARAAIRPHICVTFSREDRSRGTRLGIWYRLIRAPLTIAPPAWGARGARLFRGEIILGIRTRVSRLQFVFARVYTHRRNANSASRRRGGRRVQLTHTGSVFERYFAAGDSPGWTARQTGQVHFSGKEIRHGSPSCVCVLSEERPQNGGNQRDRGFNPERNVSERRSRQVCCARLRVRKVLRKRLPRLASNAWRESATRLYVSVLSLSLVSSARASVRACVSARRGFDARSFISRYVRFILQFSQWYKSRWIDALENSR